MQPRWTLITGGNVIDGASDQPRQATDVLVRNDRIYAVGAEANRDNVPRGDLLQVIDAGGRCVMPGLIDVHCHMTYGESRTQEEQDLYTSVEGRTLRAAWNARKVLRAGVTAISQPGGSYYIGVAIRDAIKDGMLPGPRMTTAGRYITTSNSLTDWYPEPVGVPDSSIGTLANTIPDMVDQVRRQVKNGVDLIKLADSPFGEYQAFGDDELKTIAELAHRLNRKVTIHARGSAEVSAAVAAGLDWIMHGNVMTDETIAEFGHLAGAPLKARDGSRRMLDKTADSLHRAHAAGVTMVVGTDTGFATTPYGEWHARELELLMTYAGLSAAEAISAATVNAAPMLNLAGQIGEIRAGCLADIIVVAGDPTKDIRVLQDPANIQVVMKGGTVVGFDYDRPISSWPHERSRVQATTELTRAVVHDGERAVPDNLPWAEEEARDLFADLSRAGRAAQAETAEEAAAVAPLDEPYHERQARSC